MAFTATQEPTVYGQMSASGNDSWASGIVWSYLVSSGVSIAKGDYVKLASSTTGTITKCSSTGDGASFLGIAVGALDNSAGTTASSTSVGVLRQGIAITDILVASSSGTQKAAAFQESQLFLADDETGVTVTEGQALTATDNGTAVAKSIDYIAVPSASGLFKGRVYINTLLKTPLD
jgi:hypothetical protein